MAGSPKGARPVILGRAIVVQYRFICFNFTLKEKMGA
jgi:hypothetical protein